MEVVAYDPYIPHTKADSLHVELMSDLEGAVSLADMVTIHTPLTEETANMIDESMLRVFKHGAYLVNCARGGIVDEACCRAQAVRDGRLGGIRDRRLQRGALSRRDNPFLAEDIADRIVINAAHRANTVEAQSEVSRIAAQKHAQRAARRALQPRGEPALPRAGGSTTTSACTSASRAK